MKEYINIIKKSKLFLGLEEHEIKSMLSCLSATTHEYKKNEYVLYAGEIITCFEMVLSGSVHVIKEDFWGNKSILSEISEGQLFGETYACAFNVPLNVSVTCIQDTKTLRMDVKRIITSCPTACTFHTRLIQNLIMVIAGKNLMLTEKIEHMAQRTTRNKLISYLSEQSQKANNPSFMIPYNRQQLADFLCVDRSAMSNELCKMREEGIIEFNKNKFKML